LRRGTILRLVLLHLGILGLLFLLQFVLPPYHHANTARILVFAAYAVGYNLLLGYTGLMSLGHALFFAAGLYGAGLPVYYLGAGALGGFGLGVLASFGVTALFGLIVLRTSGVSFLIVTLMFAQAAFLATLYFNEVTLGDQGLILSSKLQAIALFGLQLPIADPAVKYNAALIVFAACFLAVFALVRSPLGRVFIAVRENEPRTRMLGYDTFAYKFIALVISGTISGAAGAAYGLLFSYVGSTFVSIQYSILPLLWVLLGGAGTTIGPLIGTALMFYLTDYAGDLTTRWLDLPTGRLIVVGLALVALVLWFPRGVVGTLRERWLPWLP
jgi:branched-chain amino acid transport system permease protein